jgi:hypothetical protein
VLENESHDSLIVFSQDSSVPPIKEKKFPFSSLSLESMTDQPVGTRPKGKEERSWERKHAEN